MRRAEICGLLLAAWAVAGCEVVVPGTSALEACTSAARDYAGTVAGSFGTDVAAIRALTPGAQPARWPDLSPDHPAVLCYVDAEIPKAPPPGPDGQISPSFDRALVAVVDGESEMSAAGYRDRLPVRAP